MALKKILGLRCLVKWAPDFEQKADTRSYHRDRYWYSDCYISFGHYKIDFITYFNLVDVINYQVDDILILKTSIFKVYRVYP